MENSSRITRRYCTTNCRVLPYLLVVLLTISATAAPDWSDCPSACHCKWTSGKKKAVCISAGYSDIPSLSSEIQVLDLQNNYITYLKKDAFISANLSNLQKVFMKNTTLREIHRDAFRDLTILIELDLSNNEINSIHRGTFAGNDRLRILCLSGNPLKTLSNEQFPKLPHLRSLELENCQLHTISQQAFIHLAHLENLSLKHNFLKNAVKSIFTPMTKLKALNLAGNPWNCDCDLRAFRNWYLVSNLNSVSVSCRTPSSQKGKLWEEIPSLQFACPPEVTVGIRVVRKYPGDNVTFGCLAKGDPEPEVSWLYNGYPLSSVNGSRMEQGFLIEVEKQISEKWINLTLANLTDSDAGEYICQTDGFSGVLSQNVTLVIAHESLFPEIGETNYLLIFVGCMFGGFLILIIITFTLTCTCINVNKKKKRKKHRKKAKAQDNKSFYDQEKHLLDMSTPNTEQPSGKSSYEMLSSHASTELLKNSSSVSVDKKGGSTNYYTSRRPVKEATAVIPLDSVFSTGMGGFPPPPPEFSNGLSHSGTLGNIYISVSLTQDPNITVDRYPDLLDVHHSTTLSNDPGSSYQDSRFCGLSVAPYATLPRRHLRPVDNHRPIPVYDNMGKRVTIGGSSVLSLPDEDYRIPTPPPPPLSTKPEPDYIPL